ncbi:MAG: DUF4382 domain-containing protein [Chitinophagaceae bacterium]|nr:DUF4382 domain-containing protein [Chitinophagaceae bacterium]
MNNKALFIAIALLASTVGFYACKKNKDEMTNLKVHLTDAPYNASEVNVDIREVNVKFTDDSSGWFAIPTVAGIYNLLEFQNGIDTLLAAGPVPRGMLKEIRFVLGSNNSIVINNTEYPLTIPSGASSGLKIKVNKTLAASVDSILIDFDAALSIIKESNGSYSLKPVLKLK